jgi:hypothetical protein
MTISDKFKDFPNPQLPVPSAGQYTLFLVVLGWLAFAPIVVGTITALLPETWQPLVIKLMAVMLLAGFLFVPLFGFSLLVSRRNWDGMKPFALALLMTGIYILIATTIRAVAQVAETPYDFPPFSETTLRLTVLTLAVLVIGGGGLMWTGVPRKFWMVSHAFGFDRPPIAGLLTSLILIAIATIGWPLTGSLGDSWVSLLIVLQAFATALPMEIFFRGAILGVITFNFQHRKILAAITALLIYLAFIPSLTVPLQDWGKLGWIILLIPLALLTTELRALTGSIWAGILFATVYFTVPQLFTDPRVEMAFIVQPWQTTAYAWLVIGTGMLALLLWAGRQFLMPRRRWSGLITAIMALVIALFCWGLWAGLWALVGYPGFHNDGILIIMAEQADLNGAEDMDDLIARRTFVRDQLIETATRTQAPIREALDSAGLDYRPFYIINMIEVKGHHRRMDEFAQLPGVARVMLNPNVRRYPIEALNVGYGGATREAEGIEWNIDQTQADEVWAMGYTGQGIVVAGQDTGYDFRHPALLDSYRGFSSTDQVDNNYNWHDAWDDNEVPFDDDAHGTHTMGTILGDDGEGNQVGMAPDAQWIGCRNMRMGIGNPASYTDCMEFFLAPYPVYGNSFNDGDVSQAPHVVNNSWGCPDFEGCDDDVLAPAMAALRAAGIMMVVSAGNDGPACQTALEPPARYDDVFSVGATNEGGTITSFSSRGPIPGENDLLKPDITAPGANIRSSVPGGGYGLADGTSMAGPHVAGLVALIWSANPDLIGQIEETETIIRQSARPVMVNATCDLQDNRPLSELSLTEQMEALATATECTCGDVTGVPNNVYGWGEIDALSAVQMALNQN